MGEQVATLNRPGGRIVCRFHGRDLNLVLGSRADGAPVRFQVLLDGKPPNHARGLDVDERGTGIVSEDRLYQLIRQDRPITDRTFEITFADADRPGLRVHLRVGESAGLSGHTRPGRRSVTSCSCQLLPSGSAKDARLK